MLSMVSRVLITTYLTLSPPKALLSTYLNYSLVQLVGYGLVAVGHYLPSFSVPLFHSGMFMFGIGRGVFTFPYIVLARTFDRPSDAFAVVLWLTLGLVGNNWGVFLETLMEDTLQWSWYAALSVFSLVKLLAAILARITVAEEYLPDGRREFCDYATSMASIIKVYYKRRTSNSLNLLEYLFLSNQMLLLLYWPAYYFNQLGYGYASSTIVSVFPFCAALGILLCQPLFERLPAHSGVIAPILVGLSCLSFMGMLLLGKDGAEIPIYMVLLGLGAMFWVAPFQRSYSVELAGRTEDSREKYLVINFMLIVREVLTGISLAVVGILMEQGTPR